jgi:GTPase SAR1 family protein
MNIAGSVLAQFAFIVEWWEVLVAVIAVGGGALFFLRNRLRVGSDEADLPSLDVSDIERRRRQKWREGRRERERQLAPGLVLQHSVAQSLEDPIALSPDGHYLTSGANDATIRLWDVESGHEVRRLRAHSHLVRCVAWSPDGLLVSGANDATIHLWNPQQENPLQILRGHVGAINALAWSVDGQWLASGGDDRTVRVWNPQTGNLTKSLTGHPKAASCLAWAPDGRYLASGGSGGIMRVWDTKEGLQVHSIPAHANGVRSVAWFPHDGRLLASGGNDAMVRLWDPQTGREVRRLEGHIGPITGISFSPDGRLLASQSVQSGAEVRFWRTDTWELVATLPVNPFKENFPLSFQTDANVILTGGDSSDEVRIWKVDIEALMRDTQPSMQYSNAKVVLMGDSGVGKTGLGLVLTGKPFTPTESTHGRHVWLFADETVPVDEDGHVDRSSRIQEQRETLLWDLAGQAAYRVIHQLHLDEVTVALVVFDSRSETDPFGGVLHWDRSLRQSQAIRGKAALPLKKILVAARTDRGGIGVGHERINNLIKEFGFDGYIETSAKEGKNIAELQQDIQRAIQWEALPRVTSTDLFRQIQKFLITQKEAGEVLSEVSTLYNALMDTGKAGTDSPEMRQQFDCCIDLVQSQGLIQKIGFGGLILLQPETLDAYASALISSVRDEPDGLGSIQEARAKQCDFDMPQSERISNRGQEQLLLLAMIEDLVSRELALREGEYLVFPSQSTRVNPDLPSPEIKPVIFTFEGPVTNIYATLSVRLSRSGLFRRKELWKNAITFTARVGGICGLYLDNVSEGRADLALFYEDDASEETRFHFEEFVEVHLQRWAIPSSISRKRVIICPHCKTTISQDIVRQRLERGVSWMICYGCDNRIELSEPVEVQNTLPLSRIDEMDTSADRERENQTRQTKMQGWRAMKRFASREDFDVFICYNEQDGPIVANMAEKLLDKGVLPWFDEWEIQPGRSWQQMLEEQFERIGSVAVFIGKDGIGPWQRYDVHAILSEFFKRGCKVIPVILPGCEKIPPLPIFLRQVRTVDFRQSEREALEGLVWGITGQRPFLSD